MFPSVDRDRFVALGDRRHTPQHIVSAVALECGNPFLFETAMGGSAMCSSIRPRADAGPHNLPYYDSNVPRLALREPLIAHNP